MPEAIRSSAAILGLTVATVVLAASACHKADSTAGSSGGEGGAAATSSPPASLAFLKGFEGEIDGFVKDNKPGEAQVPLALFIKGDKVRFDVPEKLNEKLGAAAGPAAAGAGEKMYVIFDGDTKKLAMVLDSKKQVILFDLNKTGEELKGMGKPEHGGPPGGGAPEGPQMKLTKTGKTDTVAGYKCEYWDVSSDHREASVCVAQEGMSWFSIPMTGIPTERLWMAELLDGKHFPLRFVGYAKDGTTEETRIEVTKIDKKTLPDTEFQYPPTYATLDIAQMMHGLGAFHGIPGGPPMPGMSGMPMHGPPHGAPAH